MRTHYVDKVGLDIVEEALVMGDEDDRIVIRAIRVDAVSHSLEGVDVKPGLCDPPPRDERRAR